MHLVNLQGEKIILFIQMTTMLSMRHAHGAKGEPLNTVHAGKARLWPFIRRNTISTDFPHSSILALF